MLGLTWGKQQDIRYKIKCKNNELWVDIEFSVSKNELVKFYAGMQAKTEGIQGKDFSLIEQDEIVIPKQSYTLIDNMIRPTIKKIENQIKVKRPMFNLIKANTKIAKLLKGNPDYTAKIEVYGLYDVKRS